MLAFVLVGLLIAVASAQPFTLTVYSDTSCETQVCQTSFISGCTALTFHDYEWGKPVKSINITANGQGSYWFNKYADGGCSDFMGQDAISIDKCEPRSFFKCDGTDVYGQQVSGAFVDEHQKADTPK